MARKKQDSVLNDTFQVRKAAKGDHLKASTVFASTKSDRFHQQKRVIPNHSALFSLIQRISLKLHVISSVLHKLADKSSVFDATNKVAN